MPEFITANPAHALAWAAACEAAGYIVDMYAEGDLLIVTAYIVCAA